MKGASRRFGKLRKVPRPRPREVAAIERREAEAYVRKQRYAGGGDVPAGVRL